MLLEAGRRSDLIGWDDNDDAEDFDVQVLNRTFDPDTISVRIYGSDYTFFAAFDDIELFLKLFKLGAKGQAIALLKERSTKNKLVVVTFKSIDTQDVKKLLLGLSDIVDSTHYTKRQNSATLYFDNAVQDAQVDLVIQNIEDQGYTVVNTTKKYRKLDVSPGKV